MIFEDTVQYWPYSRPLKPRTVPQKLIWKFLFYFGLFYVKIRCSTDRTVFRIRKFLLSEIRLFPTYYSTVLTVQYRTNGTVPYRTNGTVLYRTNGTVPYRINGTVPYRTNGTVAYRTTVPYRTMSHRYLNIFKRNQDFCEISVRSEGIFLVLWNRTISRRYRTWISSIN